MFGLTEIDALYILVVLSTCANLYNTIQADRRYARLRNRLIDTERATVEILKTHRKRMNVHDTKIANLINIEKGRNKFLRIHDGE